MKYFITLFFISILSISCIVSKSDSYRMLSVYYNGDSTFYNFENVKQPYGKITICADSGQYRVGDVMIMDKPDNLPDTLYFSHIKK
jgi:hypothetical protein